MIINDKRIQHKELSWALRCAKEEDAAQLSKLRVKIDGETENLDRESGEGFLSKEDFQRIISEDSIAERNIFLVSEVEEKIVGFARIQGNTLSRFRHKAEFGICILKDYWGYGIGQVLLENILMWADSAGIKKISLTVIETNVKAIELYRRYDFIEEGLLINDRIHKDGKYYNTVIMGRFCQN